MTGLRAILAGAAMAAVCAGAAQAQVPTTRSEAYAVIETLNPAILPEIPFFYEIERGDAQEQIMAGFAGPMFETETLASFVMVTGCRQHSCAEKTSLVYEGDRLAAIVLTHFRCNSFPDNNDCFLQPIFTLIGGRMETLQDVLAALRENDTVRQFFPSERYFPEGMQDASEILISLPDWDEILIGAR